eukprot:8481056-Pyramimonas_sp.AAC.1
MVSGVCTILVVLCANVKNCHRMHRFEVTEIWVRPTSHVVQENRPREMWDQLQVHSSCCAFKALRTRQTQCRALLSRQRQGAGGACRFRHWKRGRHLSLVTFAEKRQTHVYVRTE